MKPALIPFAVLVAIQLTCVQVNIPQIPELCRRCLQPIGSLIARGIKKMSMRSSSFWDDDYLFIGWAGDYEQARAALGNPVRSLSGSIGGVGRGDSASVQRCRSSFIDE